MTGLVIQEDQVNALVAEWYIEMITRGYLPEKGEPYL